MLVIYAQSADAGTTLFGHIVRDPTRGLQARCLCPEGSKWHMALYTAW